MNNDKEELEKGAIKLSNGEIMPPLITCENCLKRCSQYWIYCPLCGYELPKNKCNDEMKKKLLEPDTFES